MLLPQRMETWGRIHGVVSESVLAVPLRRQQDVFYLRQAETKHFKVSSLSMYLLNGEGITKVRL